MLNKQTLSDIEELKEIYIQLKEIMVKLYDIETKHPHTKHFRERMENILLELNKVDHEAIQEATLLKEEEQK